MMTYGRWANPPKAVPGAAGVLGAAQTLMPTMGIGASVPNPMGMQVYFVSLFFIFLAQTLQVCPIHGCQLYFRHSLPPSLHPLPSIPPSSAFFCSSLFLSPLHWTHTHTGHTHKQTHTHTHWTQTSEAMMQQMLEQQKQQQNLLKINK